jgi:hypothetical protein
MIFDPRLGWFGFFDPYLTLLSKKSVALGYNPQLRGGPSDQDFPYRWTVLESYSNAFGGFFLGGIGNHLQV